MNAKLTSRFLRTPVGWSLARMLGKRSGPPPGYVRFGSFRSIHPIDPHWGCERGLPIDRYYIEKFIGAHASDIRGHVLEVRDDKYTRRFGNDRVRKSDVISLRADDGIPTIVADLTRAPSIPSDAFDCIILTQTLQYIYDLRRAVGTLYRILAPGGVLLATVPTVCKIDSESRVEYWRLTSRSCSTLLGKFFPPGALTINSYGNVLSAVAILEGLAARELSLAEIEYCDPEYEVIVSIRAVKPEPSRLPAGHVRHS